MGREMKLLDKEIEPNQYRVQVYSNGKWLDYASIKDQGDCDMALYLVEQGHDLASSEIAEYRIVGRGNQDILNVQDFQGNGRYSQVR